MPQPISPGLRQRIFAAVQAGESTAEAALLAATPGITAVEVRCKSASAAAPIPSDG